MKPRIASIDPITCNEEVEPGREYTGDTGSTLSGFMCDIKGEPIDEDCDNKMASPNTVIYC
jgi:hypothetical protein